MLLNHFMFASFKSGEVRRGTQILVADLPLGPFKPHSDGPVTPGAWECLDGTQLYADKNGISAFIGAQWR